MIPLVVEVEGEIKTRNREMQFSFTLEMPFSSTCNVTKKKYDVFISFHGSDVRKGLLSHIEGAFRREKINYFVDEKLDKGSEIASSLQKAIEESRIAVVIFSKDYASSKWCLDEFATIIDCYHKNEQQIVLPVFFDVDPSDIRNQHGVYAYALAEHEKKENMDKVQSWRLALKEAADKSGFHYSTSYKNEFDLVQAIGKDILSKSGKKWKRKLMKKTLQSVFEQIGIEIST